MAQEQVSKRNFGGPFPEHIAIIMDGNGRWAEERGMLRVQGHAAGIASVRDVTTKPGDRGMVRVIFSPETIHRSRGPLVTLAGAANRILARAPGLRRRLESAYRRLRR